HLLYCPNRFTGDYRRPGPRRHEIATRSTKKSCVLAKKRSSSWRLRVFVSSRLHLFYCPNRFTGDYRRPGPRRHEIAKRSTKKKSFVLAIKRSSSWRLRVFVSSWLHLLYCPNRFTGDYRRPEPRRHEIAKRSTKKKSFVLAKKRSSSWRLRVFVFSWLHLFYCPNRFTGDYRRPGPRKHE